MPGEIKRFPFTKGRSSDIFTICFSATSGLSICFRHFQCPTAISTHFFYVECSPRLLDYALCPTPQLDMFALKFRMLARSNFAPLYLHVWHSLVFLSFGICTFLYLSCLVFVLFCICIVLYLYRFVFVSFCIFIVLYFHRVLYLYSFLFASFCFCMYGIFMFIPRCIVDFFSFVSIF